MEPEEEFTEEIEEQPEEEGTEPEETEDETGEEEDEVPPTDDEEEPEEEPAPKPKSKEAGLVATAKAEREKRQQLERELAEIRAAQEAVKVPTPEEEAKFIEAEVLKHIGPKPTRESCNFDEDLYLDALTDWKQAKGETSRELREHIKWQNETMRSEAITKGKFLADVKAKGEAEFKEDFLETAFIPMGAERLFAKLDNAAAVAYALGKDPAKKNQLCSALNRRDTEEAALILGRISASVTRSKGIASKTVKQKPTTTQRPGAGGEQSTSQKAVKAARDKALQTGNFADYLERIGAY